MTAPTPCHGHAGARYGVPHTCTVLCTAWNPAHDAEAARRGWGLFDTGGAGTDWIDERDTERDPDGNLDHDPLEVERLDDPDETAGAPYLASDPLAWLDVAVGAHYRDPTALAALDALTEAGSVTEHARILALLA